MYLPSQLFWKHYQCLDPRLIHKKNHNSERIYSFLLREKLILDLSLRKLEIVAKPNEFRTYTCTTYDKNATSCATHQTTSSTAY